MKKGKILPSGNDITKQEKENTVSSGNDIPKELTKAQKRFRYIRESVYKIGRDKLAANIGLFDGTTIKNYETKPGYKISVDTLIKCADYLSSIPNKDKEINHISLDYLLGRTTHTSMNCKAISDLTGLDDGAINRLKSLYDTDLKRELYNSEHLLDKFVNPYPVRLSMINFLLKSESLEALCDTFSDYVNADEYTKLLAETDKGMGEVKSLIAMAGTRMIKPLDYKELYSKANLERAFLLLLHDLDNEWHNQSGFDIVKEFPELFDKYCDMLKQEGYNLDREEAAQTFREGFQELTTKADYEKAQKLIVSQLKDKLKQRDK